MTQPMTMAEFLDYLESQGVKIFPLQRKLLCDLEKGSPPPKYTSPAAFLMWLNFCVSKDENAPAHKSLSQ